MNKKEKTKIQKPFIIALIIVGTLLCLQTCNQCSTKNDYRKLKREYSNYDSTINIKDSIILLQSYKLIENEKDIQSLQNENAIIKQVNLNLEESNRDLRNKKQPDVNIKVENKRNDEE